MYLFENITINRREDRFFDELSTFPVDLSEKFTDFRREVEEKCGRHIFNKKLQITEEKLILEDGSWALRVRAGYFKSIEGVEEFWNTFFDEYSRVDTELAQITKFRKEWSKDNDSRSQSNVVDINGKFIKTLNSCTQGICSRNRDSNDGGCWKDAQCWEQHTEKTMESFHHIPVSKIVSRNKVTRKTGEVAPWNNNRDKVTT